MFSTSIHTAPAGVARVTLALAILLAAIIAPQGSARAADSKAIVALDRDTLSAKGLKETAPLHAKVRLKGLLKTSERRVFAGEFVADVWHTEDGGVLAVDGQPFDQFVQVLSGRAVLRAHDGTTRSFKKGDSFVVPKGFVGTWSMTAGYRELLIIDAMAYEQGISAYE